MIGAKDMQHLRRNKMKELKRLQHQANKILNEINRGAWCNEKELKELWQQYDEIINEIKDIESEVNK